MKPSQDSSIPLPVYGLVNIVEWNNTKFSKLPEVMVEFLQNNDMGIRIAINDNIPLILQKLANRLNFEDYKCILSLKDFASKTKEAMIESRKISPENLLRGYVLAYSK